MNRPRPLSTESVHSSTVAIDGRAVLLMGPSGAGKSDLTLRLIDRGFTLISDDQTLLSRDHDTLRASAPASIAGKLEIRGIGIVEMATQSNVPLALAVELKSDVERMPDASRELALLGVTIPLIAINAMTASAPAKIVLALDRLGLK